MVIIRKVKSDNSVKGQLRNLIRDIGFETMKELKETGKEVVKGVTMLPGELLFTAQKQDTDPNNPSDWEKEWLKDKDDKKPDLPVSGKTGGHTKIDPNRPFQRNDQQEIERIQRQIQNSLHASYSRPSATSQYGQQKAQEQQKEQKPVYVAGWEEREDKKKKEAQAKPKTILPTGFKRRPGDWKRGTKLKKGANPQEMHPEYSANQSKQ